MAHQAVFNSYVATAGPLPSIEVHILHLTSSCEPTPFVHHEHDHDNVNVCARALESHACKVTQHPTMTLTSTPTSCDGPPSPHFARFSPFQGGVDEFGNGWHSSCSYALWKVSPSSFNKLSHYVYIQWRLSVQRVGVELNWLHECDNIFPWHQYTCVHTQECKTLCLTHKHTLCFSHTSTQTIIHMPMLCVNNLFHTHTQTHTQIQTHTHPHTHAHIYIYMYICE